MCSVLLLRLLMEHAEQAILEGKGDCEDGARDVVGLAHDSISWLGEQEGAVILGSSTICLGLVRPGGLLEMANVGDSGFRVIRGDETVFASEVRCLQGINQSINQPKVVVQYIYRLAASCKGLCSSQLALCA